MNIHLSVSMFSGLLCVLCFLMALRARKREKKVKYNLSAITSLRWSALQANTFEDFNRVIDGLLAIDNRHPYSREVEHQMDELNAYVMGRKDGRPSK